MKIRTISKIFLKNIQHWYYKFTSQPTKIIPYKALLQMTNDCNSRCSSCHIWTINKNSDNKKLEVSPSEWEGFFRSFNKNLLWLSLSGGEVTLIEEWDQFIGYIKKYCPHLSLVTFTTNGLLPEKALELALKFKQLGVDLFVTVSLDGDKKTHDEIRGVQGNYELAFTTKSLLKENKIPVYFGITLSESNHKFVLESYKTYKNEMKAVSFLHSEGIYHRKNTLNDSVLLKSLKAIRAEFKIEKFSEIIEWLYIVLAEQFLASERKSSVIPCDVLSSSVHVMPNGDLHPCMFLKKVTNIRDENFFQSLTSKESIALREKIKKGECPKCWMNCYTPHSIMQSPVKSLVRALWPM